ncbi:sulfurtransferase [bacterium]|nr:sulfurtransferase [bacterium]
MEAELIAASALAERLNETGLRIVDASWHAPPTGLDARALHREAHLPGAVFFDIDAVAGPPADLPHMLPTPETFAAAVGALGIAESDVVVVYDQTGIASAACRAWWTFRHFGQARVAVLDGGLPLWRAAGLPLAAGEAAPAPCAREPRAGCFAVWDRAAVLANLERCERLLVDARSRERFAGRGPELWGDPGRIPGSVNLPYQELLDERGCLLPDAVLEALVEAAGVPRDRPFAVTCGSGATACVLAFAFARLGQRDVALYDGSWVDWVRAADTPRARD